MNNNKGFAITATIYSFLVLFLIILLSILAILRSENNRSITVSERIEANTFLYNEVAYDTDEYRISSGNSLGNLKRGKYYLILIDNYRNAKNAASDHSTIYDCYVYFPQSGIFSLEDGVLKVNGNNAIIYGETTTGCSNANLSEVIIIKSNVANAE